VQLGHDGSEQCFALIVDVVLWWSEHCCQFSNIRHPTNNIGSLSFSLLGRETGSRWLRIF
jgi:hypothetical protein